MRGRAKVAKQRTERTDGRTLRWGEGRRGGGEAERRGLLKGILSLLGGGELREYGDGGWELACRRSLG